MDTQQCYHCGLPVPDGTNYSVDILGERRQVCCPGCQAVAATIVDSGYERFYDKRNAKSLNPEVESRYDLAAFDNIDIQSKFVRQIDNDIREVTLVVAGINCGACLWLIESSIADIDGVTSVLVNFSTRRALVRWDQGKTSLQQVLAAFAEIGFAAHPYEYRESSVVLQNERDQLLRKIGVSGVLGMQIMMIAVALYFGKSSGISLSYRYFFEWVSLFLVLPVVFYCAQPFFSGAVRGLTHRQPTIDVPVSLGIGIAFLASLWATITATGDTYFEAISMFVFLLLSTHYFELSARERGLDAVAHIQDALPAMARRIDEDGRVHNVPAVKLEVGDRILIGVGESVPADAVVLEGATSMDESVISGESAPVAKLLGSDLVGGSANLDNPVTARISRTHDHSLISAIATLAERAQSAKPRFVRLVDRVAIWFVVGLVLVAGAVAVYCWWYAPERLLTTVIAVLVIACPCALSLATPAALSASVGTLTRRGIILLKGDSLEKLTAITQVVFDKTGTLTEGNLKLDDVQASPTCSTLDALHIANALELSSPSHPVARALARAVALDPDADETRAAERLQHTAGAGVSGYIGGRVYHFGSQSFIQGKLANPLIEFGPTSDRNEAAAISCLLADQNHVIAVFTFLDQLRPEAEAVVSSLRNSGMGVSILSGDRRQTVAGIARSLRIEDYFAQLSPQQKLDVLKQYQTQGKTVLAIGDGVNDAPILAAATVGVAMGSGADLARITGDVVLINNKLTDLNILLSQAHRTRRIIMQNFIWALGYNVLALPLGIMGLVPPWIAVIGMSLSSLVVVVNALRLSKRGRMETAHPDEANRENWAYA